MGKIIGECTYHESFDVVDGMVNEWLLGFPITAWGMKFKRRAIKQTVIAYDLPKDATGKLVEVFRLVKYGDKKTKLLNTYPVQYEPTAKTLTLLWGHMDDELNTTTPKPLVISAQATPTKPPMMQAQSETSRAVNEPVDSNAILRRIVEMHSDLGEKLDAIKQFELIIYERIGSEAQSTVNSILSELRKQAISQGEMQRMLDAIRRALKYAMQKGLPVDDPAIKQSLEEIYKAVNSNASIKQQLELSLPVIPYLLNYKVGLDMGADLGAVWKEWTERVQKTKNN